LCDPGTPLTIEPDWLDACYPATYTLDDVGPHEYTELRRLPIAIDPSVDLSGLAIPSDDRALVVDIEGRYDHPAAAACRAVGGPDAERAPELVILDCRAQFVITGLKVHVDS
jgi:hypothetical protein